MALFVATTVAVLFAAVRGSIGLDASGDTPEGCHFHFCASGVVASGYAFRKPWLDGALGRLHATLVHRVGAEENNRDLPGTLPSEFPHAWTVPGLAKESLVPVVPHQRCSEVPAPVLSIAAGRWLVPIAPSGDVRATARDGDSRPPGAAPGVDGLHTDDPASVAWAEVLVEVLAAQVDRGVRPWWTERFDFAFDLDRGDPAGAASRAATLREVLRREVPAPFDLGPKFSQDDGDAAGGRTLSGDAGPWRARVSRGTLTRLRDAFLPGGASISAASGRAAREGCIAVDNSFFNAENGCSAEKPHRAARAYLHGASIVVNGAEGISRAASRVAHEWTWASGHRTRANVYVTPPGGKRGFPWHSDKQDVLVVQLRGRKAWEWWDPRSRESAHESRRRRRRVPPHLALPHETVGKRGEGFEPPADAGQRGAADLSPGDVLLLPRGMVHRARTGNRTAAPSAEEPHSDEGSVHVSISLVTSSSTWARTLVATGACTEKDVLRAATHAETDGCVGGRCDDPAVHPSAVAALREAVVGAGERAAGTSRERVEARAADLLRSLRAAGLCEAQAERSIDAQAVEGRLAGLRLNEAVALIAWGLRHHPNHARRGRSGSSAVAGDTGITSRVRMRGDATVRLTPATSSRGGGPAIDLETWVSDGAGTRRKRAHRFYGERNIEMITAVVNAGSLAEDLDPALRKVSPDPFARAALLEFLIDVGVAENTAGPSREGVVSRVVHRFSTWATTVVRWLWKM